MQRARLAVLIAAVALTASLPLAGALAGPADEGAPRSVPRESARESAARDHAARDEGVVRDDDAGAGGDAGPSGAAGAGAGQRGAEAGASGDEGRRAAPERASEGGLLSGLGLAASAQCGPELASPEGVEAQTCVLAQAGDAWARTYYRNATGEQLRAVLTLMGPGGRTVQMHCAVGAGDEPGACETPREPARAEPSAYTAVAEFAAPEGAGGKEAERPLLLRAGSNSPHMPRS
ncbi:hypothetical protein [Streptomyces sp. Da 82-17]|uniref:hypothetical protein n=1 Tax=Streptomyces sp. Da 82-17 TaxID=3377116 RepID=UPI0038D5126D